MIGKSHWENIYSTKDSTQVSWFTPKMRLSLELIQRTGIPKTAQIIDVGGGTSRLVDDLLRDQFEHVTVLDISDAALHGAQGRLGADSAKVTWLEADITQVTLPERHYDLWHDRAVFHFFTRAEDRHQYVDTVRRSLKVGGHIITATFAPDGPNKCSGLDVLRYDPNSLHGEFGGDFELITSLYETHHTPFGTTQSFVYCYCQKH